MKLCKWFCISEVSSLNVTRPSCRISSLNCLAIVQDRTHQFCRVVTRTRSISLLLTQWSNSGGIWLTRSKCATQAVCPTVIEAIFEQEFGGSELFSFSSFEQLAKAQASSLFEKKKICNVYWSADQECHSSNRSPCSQLPPLLQDEWMEASGINMATRPIKNRHDWKMASAKKLHLFETSFSHFYVLLWQTGFRDRFCPVGNSRSKVEMLSRGFDY